MVSQNHNLISTVCVVYLVNIIFLIINKEEGEKKTPNTHFYCWIGRDGIYYSNKVLELAK